MYCIAVGKTRYIIVKLKNFLMIDINSIQPYLTVNISSVSTCIYVSNETMKLHYCALDLYFRTLLPALDTVVSSLREKMNLLLTSLPRNNH